jgi:uncharacterized protein (TIGR02594 family)
MASVPASIRNNNPGAQYPGPSSRKFGAIQTNTIGGGHLIAQFPNKVAGGAALFDLLLRGYVGLTVQEALAKWAWGKAYKALVPDKQKNVDSYVKVICKRTGLEPGSQLSRAYLTDQEDAVTFAKAMARHEAGKEFPMSDEEWEQAHDLALGKVKQKDIETATPWLDIAVSKVGMKEIPGKEHNPEIVRMFDRAGHKEITNDETAWCAVFAYWCLTEAGYPGPAGTDGTMARSFLRYGVPVKPKDVRPGDLRIEERGPAPYGHIEIVTEVNGDSVETVAGNVSNSVKYATKPLTPSKGLLGYRRPILGDKPIIVAAKESPSVMMLANAALMTIVGWVIYCWNWVLDIGGYVLSSLPLIADHVSTSMGSSKTIAEQAGLSLPSKVLFGLALTSTVFAIVRLIQQRR